MPILPIDSKRYGTVEMRRIFEEEARLQRMLDVEAALCYALAEVGELTMEDARLIHEKASVAFVKLDRVKEIENRIQHDVMAIVEALSEVCGEVGGRIHFGATSNDINDTATALQFKDALQLLQQKLIQLEETLIMLSEKYADTIMVGRTHGQHALPLTLGLKFAVWMMEVNRHLIRLNQCRDRVLVGKMTGGVGTQAGFGVNGRKIQELTMKRLGLTPVEVSTQIVQRDRYAELINLLALIASSLEKFAGEIRELQRTELGELAEAFDVKTQVGSSTMPHKMNPMTSERICGLAKLVRCHVIPALENVVNWQERDLTHSSNERFIIPTCFILVDYMLALMNRVLRNINVNEARMKANLELTQGRLLSEAVMLALTRKGLPRQQAHEILRKASMRSVAENIHFKDVLLADATVRSYLSEEEISNILNPQAYLGTTREQIANAVAIAKTNISAL